MATRSKTAERRAPRTVRDPVSTRARIVAEAERLFAERGFDGVSMPAIAAAAGITAGAIYKHFDGKAALFFEVIRRSVVARPTATTDAAADDSETGVSGAPTAVAAYSTKALKRLRQMAIEVHYAAAKDPLVRRMLRGSLDRDIGAMTAGLAAAQAAGEIDPAPDPQLMAIFVFVVIMGQMHLETLAPQLVGDAGWQAFVEARMATVIGLPASGTGRRRNTRGHRRLAKPSESKASR